MLRSVGVLLLSMAAATSAAHASSSFVVIGTPKATPSIVSMATAGKAVATAKAGAPTIELMQVDLTKVTERQPPKNSSYSRPPARAAIISSSIVALGEPLPDVAYDKVAAIPEPVAHSRQAAPLLVIRGGIVGDAFSPASPAPAAAQPAQQTAATDKAPASPAPTEPAAPVPPAASAPPPTAVRE